MIYSVFFSALMVTNASVAPGVQSSVTFTVQTEKRARDVQVGLISGIHEVNGNRLSTITVGQSSVEVKIPSAALVTTDRVDISAYGTCTISFERTKSGDWSSADVMMFQRRCKATTRVNLGTVKKACYPDPAAGPCATEAECKQKARDAFRKKFELTPECSGKCSSGSCNENALFSSEYQGGTAKLSIQCTRTDEGYYCQYCTTAGTLVVYMGCACTTVATP